MNISQKLLAYGLEDAVVWAREAHDSVNQKRKYSNEEYWHHSERVALTLIKHGVRNDSILVAALFHDIVEDVFSKTFDFKYSISGIATVWGWGVSQLVNEVTNVYTKRAFPALTRRVRHDHERTRIATISNEAQLIKLADIIDNLSDIDLANKDFAKLYKREKSGVLRDMEEAKHYKFHSFDIELLSIWNDLFDKASALV